MTLEEAHIQSAADEATRILGGGDAPNPLGRQLIAAIRHVTVEAPLHALAVAFVLGVIVARRRR